jgi:hypothetical protein
VPQVDVLATPAGLPAQAEALVAAWRIALGRDPPLSLVELNLAQLALENANGKAIWNNNPGNLTTGNDSVDYYILSKLSTDNQGHPVDPDSPSRVTLKFRAFPDLPSGMQAYISFVQSRVALVRAGTNGDALEYATAIRSSGYTPGIDPAAVAVSLQSEISGFRKAQVLDRYGLPGAGSGLETQLPPGHPVAGFITLVGGLLLAWSCRNVQR